MEPHPEVENNGIDNVLTNDKDQIKMSGVNEVNFQRERILDRRCIKDCEMYSVIVYLDRAEVCRLVPITLAADKPLEIIFSGLSSVVDRESFRIESGSAPVIIQDVTYRSTTADTDGQLAAEVEKNLVSTEQKQRELIRSRNSLEARMSRLMKQRCVLEKFADVLAHSQNGKEMGSSTAATSAAAVTGMSGGGGGGGGDEINATIGTTAVNAAAGGSVTSANDSHQSSNLAFSDAFDPKHMETLNGFFDMYDKQSEKLDEQILSTKDELEKVEAEFNKTQSKKKELEDEREKLRSRELSVYLEAREQVEAELLLYYVVTQSRWEPSYDIRIINSESKMKITYYALVHQFTGEDWLDIKELSVSTLQPPVGGCVPDIGVQRVMFKPGTGPGVEFSKGYRSINPISKGTRESLDSVAGKDQLTPLGTMSRQKNQQKLTDTPSAYYKIPRAPAAIESSTTEPEKMVIGYIDLVPNFEFASVPKKAPYAYLKATSVNQSDFVILPGEANVFIDSNYIGKSELRTVSPGETFTCHVGADARVRISYHPMYKYRDGTSGGKTTSLTFKQMIEVTNTHPRSIKITLTDQLPIATEDKIKVNLQEPVIKHPEKYDRSKPIRMNRNSQVEWDLDIAAGEKKELVLKYTVEYPSGECLDVVTDT